MFFPDFVFSLCYTVFGSRPQSPRKRQRATELVWGNGFFCCLLSVVKKCIYKMKNEY